MRKAALVYDLNECDRECIATRNSMTAQPCAHGYTWQCPHAIERFLFITRSGAAADAMGEAVLSDPEPLPALGRLD